MAKTKNVKIKKVKGGAIKGKGKSKPTGGSTKSGNEKSRY